MSDSFDQVTEETDPSDPTRRQPFDVDLERAEPATVREGLPRTYRMRADRHYVEQIGGDVGHPVRMLPLALLECAPPEDGDELRPLVESVRAHGIVHPLLVRRHRDGYQVIAGRKRVAVAHLLRLATIPCIVHDVSPSELIALAAADNLSTGARRGDAGRDFSAVRRLASEHLARIRRAAELPIGPHGASLDACGAAVLKAHAARAAFLLDALELLERPDLLDPAGSSAIAPVVDEVVRTFGHEAQLRRIDLRVEMDGYHSVPVDRRPLTAAVAGALLATLSAVGDLPHATIVVRAFRRAADGAALEIAQGDRHVAQAALDRLSAPDALLLDQVDYAAALGLLTARAVVERRGGAIEFSASVGTRLKLTFRGIERAEAPGGSRN